MVVRPQLGGLKNHIQVRVAACVLDPRDLTHDAKIVTGEERLARDHHVDLIGSGCDRILGVTQLRFK